MSLSGVSAMPERVRELVSLEVPSFEQISGLGAGELEWMLVALEHARRQLEASMVDVIDVADRDRVFADDGHRTVRNWLVALTGISPAEAHRRCQTMRALRDLDELRERLRAGEVGVCQVRDLARVHANPRVRVRLRRAEHLLVATARRRCYDEFSTRLDRWTAAADVTGTALTHDEVHAGRRARVEVTGAGVTVSAHGGTAQGAQMLEIFAAYVNAEFTTETADLTSDGCGTVARTSAQRQFDALFAIFTAAAERPHPQTGKPVNVATVNVIVDQQTLEAHLVHAAGGPPPTPADPNDMSRRCETDRGIPLDPRDAVIALLVGRLRRVVYDSAGVVLDLGRKQRLFTGQLREAVWLQGRQCLWPGCGLDAHQQDHTDEWAAHHGTTCTRNGGPGCKGHNIWKTTGYRTWRDHDGIWHTRRTDGTELTQPRHC